MRASLGELARSLGLPCREEWAPIEITGVTDDSRQVGPGMLFVAHRGTTLDGHIFIEEAIARGAAAIVAERYGTVTAVPQWIVPQGRRALAHLAAAVYEHPTREMRTVGVTGTNGKTSVCHYIAHLLGPETTAVIGTVVNAAGDLRSMTTPSSPVIQRLAREAVDQGKRTLVIEASSAGLEQSRLADIDFDVAVFTNLTRDHLDLHGTMEAYGDAKATLFRGLEPSAWAVVNADDPFSRRLRTETLAHPLTYGIREASDLRGEILAESPGGTSVRIRRGIDSADVVLSLHGEHNVSNALAALAAASCCGLAFEDGVDRLPTLPVVPGRWQTLGRADGVTAVVDYAHTPDGLERTLVALRQRGERVIVVFGCAGGSDRGKRPQMGEIATRLADLVVLTSDNPKYDDAEAIVDEIAEGAGAGTAKIVRRVDRQQAIAYAAAAALSGDVILIAGKGHETYQMVRGEFLPHSDVETLERLGFCSGA